MEERVIDNNRIFTKEKNSLLFLHGYLSSKQSFYKQLDFFAHDFDVHAINLKGFGDNLPMEKPYSLDDYLLEVKEYLYKNSLIKPSVIAHSFGGRIAIKGASCDKNLFNKLVLTGCAGLKPKTTLKKTLKKTTFNLLKKFIKREKLLKFYSSDYLALDSVMKESFKLIINEHLDDRLKYIENQTLLVFGKEDKETPLYMAKRLNRGIKNSKLIILENAGHFCFIDRSNKFNWEVREFLLEILCFH